MKNDFIYEDIINLILAVIMATLGIAAFICWLIHIRLWHLPLITVICCMYIYAWYNEYNKKG